MSYPQTEPPAPFVEKIVSVFRQHLDAIGTIELKKGLSSDAVLALLRDDLLLLGFVAEAGKRATEKIARPVFFGENGVPSLRYEIDAFHSEWRCGLEIEAGRAWMGNAVYRDLIQALVMVEVDTLVLAVPNTYRYVTKDKGVISKDYENTVSIANALYGHSRMRLPYNLVVIGY
ncbi:hypothetical protein [Hymenobacter sp.]|uniref:hypothetical protein n=1 Tax=Hymenobacter sp. TaxID=1898978 RepID=UPI00286CC537|nr:hypothetical protein [Hymenobacter sp.]